MSANDNPPESTCPVCGAFVPTGGEICTNCGEPRVRLRLNTDQVPSPARTGDIVFAVIVGLIAFAITLPTNYALTDVILRGNQNDLPWVALFAGGWNLLVWGLPVVVTARWWFLGAKRGDADKSYLWRIYWKSQIAAYGVITGLTILLLTICAAAL